MLSRADLAICHLETPLSPDDLNLSGYPVFNAPHEVADAVAGAGYDACSVASNHAFDQGSAGVAATLDALDDVGVGHAGTARTPDESARASTFGAGGATVALLDYTYPEGVPAAAPTWAVRRIDPARILADATAARRGGADLVVVTLHWGEEYRTAPTARQSALARQLLAATTDVDLVVGAHVHVVQPVERVGEQNKFVAYGLGNNLSNQSAQCCPVNSQDGVVVTAHAGPDAGGRWRVRDITFTPTWVDRTDYRVLPVAATLDRPGVPVPLRQQLSDSWRRTVAALTSLGPVEGLRPDLEPRTLSD